MVETNEREQKPGFTLLSSRCPGGHGRERLQRHRPCHEHMRESRLQQPGHREQRVGQGILQQRVCGHTLQVRGAFHTYELLWPREDAHPGLVFVSFRDVFEAWCSIRNQTMATVK